MPRVYLTELQKEQERLRNNLKLLQGGRSNAEMGKIIGACANTYANRLKNPDELTFHEVYCLCRKFRISVGRFYETELKVQ